MGCFSCFKTSTSEDDPFEAETDIVKQVSLYDDHVQEDEQEKDERRRTRELEEHAQERGEEQNNSHNSSSLGDKEAGQPSQESLKEKDKTKEVKKDKQLAAPSLPPLEEPNNIFSEAPLEDVDEDEQRSILESFKDKGQIKPSEDEVKGDVEVIPPPSYKEHRNPCHVCQKKLRKYSEHPFWKEKYCPCHDSDGTAKCCSCERLEPKGTNFVMLSDDRWLCLECMESVVMGTYEVLPLHIEIREFFEGLNMKIHKEFHLYLVERQALNKAEQEENNDNQHGDVTRGVTLSEEHNVTIVSKRPEMGPNNQLIGMVTESQRVVSECEVTAILILYGLPRLLTGYILAHEMMHAYLRLNGYRNLNNVMEEGICQVLGHMWLESQTYAPIDVASEAAASSSSSSNVGKKGKCPEYERKLVEFCKHQIETDDSPVYGVGFKKMNHMVTNSNLHETLKELIRHRG